MIPDKNTCKVCGTELRSTAELEREIWAKRGDVDHSVVLASYRFCSDGCEETDNAIRNRFALAHGWIR